MFTSAAYDEVIKLVCPHCRRGFEVTYRAATNEWQHTLNAGSRTSVTICWASGLRTSRWNPDNAPRS